MRGANIIDTKRMRRLRQDSTSAETRLWFKLKSRQLGGFKFVRQESIGPFVVDFICREHRLIVEVDGGQHADNLNDVARTRWLASRNYRVIRFWNNDVLTNIDAVLDRIATTLSASAPPHPDGIYEADAIRPLPASGGGYSDIGSDRPVGTPRDCVFATLVGSGD